MTGKQHEGFDHWCQTIYQLLVVAAVKVALTIPHTSFKKRRAQFFHKIWLATFNFFINMSIDMETMDNSTSNLTLQGDATLEARKDLIEKRDDRAIVVIRLLTIFVLVSVAVAVSFSVYFFSAEDEQSDFDQAFHDKASKLIDSFGSKAGSRLLALDTFAVDMVSYAHYSGSEWPGVTLPDFEVRGKLTIEQASLISLVLCPIVSEEERETWEAHALENRGWLPESLAVQEQSLDPTWVQPDNWTDMVGYIPHTIMDREAYETAPGPYTPTWYVNIIRGCSHPVFIPRLL